MSATLVSTLRARPQVVRLPGVPPEGEPLVVRVQVPEVWDAVRLEASPATSVLAVKRRALAELMPDETETQDFVVKLHGHEVLDESVSLRDANVRNGSTLLVTSRRRRPVR
ncbi:MAG: hypothetical protein ACREOG_13895 [Gemmatimonadaceae bacterium]